MIFLAKFFPVLNRNVFVGTTTISTHNISVFEEIRIVNPDISSSPMH